MRRVMKYRLMRRREFMKRTTLAIAGSTLGVRTGLAAGDATKGAFPTLGVSTGNTLLKVARDIYPHDRLSEEFYIQAISPYDAAAEGRRAEIPARRGRVQARCCNSFEILSTLCVGLLRNRPGHRAEIA